MWAMCLLPLFTLRLSVILYSFNSTKGPTEVCDDQEELLRQVLV